MSIPQDVIDAVRERVSLLEVIGDTVKLKRSGKTFVGLCPFHSEKTPSFHVNNEEGFFHCFGCGAKGTVFDFLIRTRGYTFPQAVEQLAERAGVAIPVPTAASSYRANASQMKQLRTVLQLAQTVYTACLKQEKPGLPGREYLKMRGIKGETAKTFALGYAPDSWEFIERETTRLLSLSKERDEKLITGLRPLLKQAGLIKEREKQPGEEQRGCYDVFRHRVIFPIARHDGAPMAFGGRLIEPGQPKYLNSPESLLYAKRRSFYGLSQALTEIRKTRHVFLVEGYLDVLSLHQAGVRDVLATCGTAVTPDHVRVISRIADRVTLVFDGDAAGRKAASACFPLFLNSGMEMSAILLEEGEDPDTFAQKTAGEKLRGELKKLERSVVEVFITQLESEYAAPEQERFESPAAVGKVAERYAALIAGVRNPVERELRVRQGAQYLGVTVQALDRLVSGAAGRRSPAPAQKKKVVHEAVEKRDVRETEEESSVPLGSYFRQLIIAVLTEPQLAQTLLEMPSLTDGAEVAEALPAEAKAFLEEIARENPAGVGGLSTVDGFAGLKDGSLSELKAVLERHRLPGDALLLEAIRQSTVGGTSPKSLVAEAGKAAARATYRKQLDEIRTKESRESDLSALERLAQEKLERKRCLDKLRGAKPDDE